jgi:aromatic-L-amino-acid decarboxylase
MIAAEPLRARIREHVGWAREFAGWVAADPRFELVATPSLSLVCFAVRTGDAASRALLDRLNTGGTAFLSHATIQGRFALRLAVGSALTERRHVVAVWNEISRLADEAAQSP